MNNITVPGQESNATDGGFSTSYIAGVTVYAAIVFIVAMIGNSLVIYIVSKREYMRNSTNILIANMAVADILMACIVIPYVLKWLFVRTQWFGTIMGTVLCKLFHSVQVISIACSVISLVFISLDRCIVICFPMRHIFTNKVLKACLVASWVYAFAFAMPIIVVTRVGVEDDGLQNCREYDWPSEKSSNNFLLSFFIGTYVIPLIVITIAYILIAVKLYKRELPGVQTLEYQKKAHETTKKAITMLVTVVVVFAVCWFPLQVREIIYIYFPETTSLLPVELLVFLTWIGVLNSAINPCLYVIFSENFRREFGRILCCCMKQNRPEAYLGIPASRATPLTTPLMSRRTVSTTPMSTPLMSQRAQAQRAPNGQETVPLRNLTIKH